MGTLEGHELLSPATPQCDRTVPAGMVNNRLPSRFSHRFFVPSHGPQSVLFKWSSSLTEADVLTPNRLCPRKLDRHPPSAYQLPPTRFLNGMSDINFRKIDIDAYDEDVLVEMELYDVDPRGPAQVPNDVKQKATAVRSALSK